MKNEVVFCYNYSAVQNEEVQMIRERYLPKEESKYDELKRLDRYVQNAGVIQSLCLGILGCLAFGFGMCLAMQVIGSSPVWGVLVGMVGVIAMLFAYPVYRMISENTEEKLKSRILQLAAELCGEQSEY